MSKSKPNILFITSDMQRGDCFGAFETRGARAPHVEMMADSGTRFSNCITPNPICMPSRASILTGMLPLAHGVYDNGIDLDPNIAANGFAGQLARIGYNTGFIGKAHFSTFETFNPTGTPECRFSSADYDENWTGPYAGFEHVELVTMGHLHRKRPPEIPPHGQHYEHWFNARNKDGEAFKLHATGLPPDTGAANTWNSALPAAWHTSTWVGDRAISYLQEQKENPFCAWVSFPDPHQPFAPPEPWSRLYHPDEVDLPEHRTMDLDRRPWWHRAALESEPQIDDDRLREHRKKVSRLPPQTDEQLRHMTANYYGMISMIDHNVGRIQAALEDLGLAENTIVIYATDHGEFLGDHGLYLKGPMMYDGLLRVGLVMTGPGIPADNVVDAPVSTMDLCATFLDYAGVGKLDGIQSETLRPFIENRAASRDVAYCEWNMQAIRAGVELHLKTVRTKTHKLTMEQISGDGELYDLFNDPTEMDNRYGDPAVSAVQRELEDMIKERPGPLLNNLPAAVGIY
ncbi:MAG: sulfatase-like hydrolase/transferase [Rhodospirillales bacterium]|nr:sulfatase-like hydrolase/transferase [Rhodospirillales bacterium]